MAKYRVEFEMDFDDKFSEDDVEEWLKYALGQHGGCSNNELSQNWDLEARSVLINKI